MNKEFWNKKKVLLTGHTGFKGSWLSLWLQKLNASVTGFSKSIPTNPSLFELANIENGMTSITGNVCDYDKLEETIKEYKPEIVIHMAAQAILRESYSNPIETYATNVMGTVNVLEAARLWGRVEGIVVVSSDKAYGKIPRASETDPISGDHPYESSKAACDLIATTYFKTYKLPVVVARFGNTYGEGDVNFSRLIPGIMKAIATESIFEIRSDGKYVRDYVYVEDIVGALISLAQNVKKVKGEAFNASSKENLSVMGVIDKVARALDIKIRYKIKRSAKNEIPVQSINFTKITKTLGWKPKYKMDERIPGIFDWYKNYFAT